MLKHPIDKQQRDTARLWPARNGSTDAAAQTPYVGCRDRRTRSWAALDRQPADDAARHLGAH